MKCDEWWGVGVGGFVQNGAWRGSGFAGDGVGKSRISWGWRLCASGLGSRIGVGGGNDGGKWVRWEAVVSKK